MTRKPAHHVDLSAFDERGELKTPKLLVLSLVFLSRYPISLALGALSTLILGRRGLEFGGLGFPPLDALGASIPPLVLLVLILFGEKATKFGWARGMIQYGVAIALASCVLQLLMVARIFAVEGMDVLNRVVIEGLLLGYCGVYLVRSEKTRTFFRVLGVSGKT
jgi:hypothetical protein